MRVLKFAIPQQFLSFSETILLYHTVIKRKKGFRNGIPKRNDRNGGRKIKEGDSLVLGRKGCAKGMRPGA